MGLKFGQVTGKAKKTANYYTYKDGDNVLRLVGDVLPRYVYWLKGGDGTSNHGIECLGFDRDTETFKNKEKDWVRHFFPDKKCSWAYVVQAIDMGSTEKKVVLVPLKKKLFEQIMIAAEDLGDPTNPDTGWDIVFKRTKTGAHAFNVEYTLQALKCKARALSDDERALIAELKPIDEIVPRPTPDEQKAYIESNVIGDGGEEVAPEGMGEGADDVPY